MPDREKVIKGLECCTQHGSMCGSDCNGHYERYTDDGYVIKLVDEYQSECPYGKCETGCVKTLAKDALELVKEQEPKAPIYNYEVYKDHLPHCAVCENVLPNVSQYGRANYCYRCGQAVKWK